MKTILSLTMFLGSIILVSGQGQINYGNSATTLITETTEGVTVPAPANLGGTNNPLVYAFFFAPGGTPAPLASPFDQLVGLHDPNWQYAGLYAVNSTATFGAGRIQNPGLGTVASYGIGSTVNMLARGWSASMGSTWAEVQAYIDANPNAVGSVYGTSVMAVNAVIGGGAFPVPSFWGSFASQVPNLNLNVVVPEPTTFALAGLGAASLLIFRRRTAGLHQAHPTP